MDRKDLVLSSAVERVRGRLENCWRFLAAVCMLSSGIVAGGGAGETGLGVEADIPLEGDDCISVLTRGDFGSAAAKRNGWSRFTSGGDSSGPFGRGAIDCTGRLAASSRALFLAALSA